MCKEARSDNLAGRLAMYRWSIDAKRLSADPPTVVPVADFARRISSNRYHPSGIERHPVSGNHFVVAARQGAIAEMTPAGVVLAAKRFTAGWHRQIEGIAFAADGSLIVADEGGGGRAILTVYPKRSGRNWRRRAPHDPGPRADGPLLQSVPVASWRRRSYRDRSGGRDRGRRVWHRRPVPDRPPGRRGVRREAPGYGRGGAVHLRR